MKRSYLAGILVTATSAGIAMAAHGPGSTNGPGKAPGAQAVPSPIPAG